MLSLNGSHMRDTDIRQALDSRLRDQHGHESDTLIRHEFGLCAGSRRVDVAVVNGEITGYEIKSDEDTLARLAGQAETYGRVLDRAVIVTTARYVEKSMAKLPDWWGVMVARTEEDSVVLDKAKHGERNEQVQPFAVAQLLWRDEALQVLRSRGLGKGLSRKARHYVWQELSEALPLPELRDVVRQCIKERPVWSDGRQRAPRDATLRTPATE